MDIVIVGAGSVGNTLAKTLAKDMHNVTVIERDQETADRCGSDVSMVVGNGARPAVLERAGVTKGCNVDVLISCTNQDETNLMSCWLAKRAGVKRVYARVKNLEFAKTPEWAEELGIDDMAAPDRSLTREIMSLLEFNAAVHSAESTDRAVGSFAFRVEQGSKICGKTLRELGTLKPTFDSLVVYVERGEEGFIPTGDWRAQEDDLCFVVTLRERVKRVQDEFFSAAGTTKKRLSNVIIVGCGKKGFALARQLTTEMWPRVHTTLIEKDAALAEFSGQSLPDVKMIVGDGMDKDLLIELGIKKTDGIVVATGNDEINVIIATIAKSLGCHKTIAIVRNPIYDNLEDKLPGVDVLLNPNYTLASTFMRYVRYPTSAKVMTLIDRIDADMLELRLTPGHRAIGKKIYELSLPQGVLIAIIKRGYKHIVPSGADVLEENDVLSLFAKSEDMPKAIEYFEAGKA